MNIERVITWQRLDVPGMDACRYGSSSDGWAISGTAIFIVNGAPAKLDYDVRCNGDWSTRTASVLGWIGRKNISLALERSKGSWRLNEADLNVGPDLLDIDLGFTPATNTNVIRRLDLRSGQEAETTALWLDTSDWGLKPLRQIYRRTSDGVFAYASPLHGYEADLVVDSFGVVLDYPGLWTVARFEHAPDM